MVLLFQSLYLLKPKLLGTNLTQETARLSKQTMIFRSSMCTTAASADGICNEATASMYSILLHINTASPLQKSDSFSVLPIGALTGSKTISFPVSPSSPNQSISFHLVIHVPKSFTPKACESLPSICDKGHFLALLQPSYYVSHTHKKTP